MNVIGTIVDLQKQIGESNLNPVGFVPTMGALHEGHISLVRNAITQSRLLVVSIFVNPNQFNDKNDLKNYPRTLEKDLGLLKKVMRKTDIVFTPDNKEIYPAEDKRKFNFGNLDNVMEALHRPGHFNGVAQVVSRLFDIVNPEFACFGMKDFQQLAVIKELVKQTGSRIKIVGNPIIRESDGLAMSSRNQLLDPEIRKRASIIYKTLLSASEMIAKNDIPDIRLFVEKTINNEAGYKVEYFDIVDDTELIPVTGREDMDKSKSYFGCIAVQAGRIRLIDNIKIPLD